MSLRLGDTAPDFTAESTEGTIRFPLKPYLRLTPQPK
jgi:peroxiredoxin